MISTLSVHCLINVYSSLNYQAVSAIFILHEKWCLIDKDICLSILGSLSLILYNIHQQVNLYNNTLNNLVDVHAILRIKERRSTLLHSWYSNDIQAEKRHTTIREVLWMTLNWNVYDWKKLKGWKK